MWKHMVATVAFMAATAGSAMADDDAGFIANFQTLTSDWYVANYDFNHDKFDTDWRRSQVVADNGLTLFLSPQEGGMNRFAGASLRRHGTSHYGRYDVTLRAARGDGVVTGFFTYTGSYYGTRHDEIDIEFLGRDTTKMHAAWFVDGELENHYIDLGFDAADRLATYGFEWLPDRLRWYVDGKLVFERLASEGPLPTVPGRLFLNIWAADPSISIWAGTAKENTETTAHVTHVEFTPMELEIQSLFDQ